MNLTSALAIAALSLLAGVAGAQQGISKNEILIGTIQDLSGPLADLFGSPALKFTPTRRLGSDESHLSQSQDRRWNVGIDYNSK